MTAESDWNDSVEMIRQSVRAVVPQGGSSGESARSASLCRASSGRCFR